MGTAYDIVVDKADDDGAVVGDYIVDDIYFVPNSSIEETSCQFSSAIICNSNVFLFSFLFRSNIDLIGASKKISIYATFMEIYRKRAFQIHPTL